MKLENHLGFSKVTVEPAQPLAKREVEEDNEKFTVSKNNILRKILIGDSNFYYLCLFWVNRCISIIGF